MPYLGSRSQQTRTSSRKVSSLAATHLSLSGLACKYGWDRVTIFTWHETCLLHACSISITHTIDTALKPYTVICSCAAYRKLAMKWHPVRSTAVMMSKAVSQLDLSSAFVTKQQTILSSHALAVVQDKNPNNREVAEKKFKQISEAYDVSSCPANDFRSWLHDFPRRVLTLCRGCCTWRFQVADHAVRRYYQTQRSGKYMMHTARKA